MPRLTEEQKAERDRLAAIEATNNLGSPNASGDSQTNNDPDEDAEKGTGDTGGDTSANGGEGSVTMSAAEFEQRLAEERQRTLAMLREEFAQKAAEEPALLQAAPLMTTLPSAKPASPPALRIYSTDPDPKTGTITRVFDVDDGEDTDEDA